MLILDPSEHIAAHQAELLQEAARQRLIAQLPPRPSLLSVGLARACLSLANWLDNSSRYVQPDQSGPEHWAAPSPSA